MAIDNTHTKHLKGSDKKAWEAYKTELEAQAKNVNFLNQFNLKKGERWESPVNKNLVPSRSKKKDKE